MAKSLSITAKQLKCQHLDIKEDSCEIVPSSTRRLQWPNVRSGCLMFNVFDEMKSLGYWITCNGDPVRNRATLTGTLRGKLAMMDRRFSGVTMAVKAKWWQLQFRGLVSYFASFIGCTCLLMQALAPVNNGGARKILGVGPGFNVSAELQRVQSEFNVCVQSFYCKSLVSYIGHCFRHCDHPVSKLMSLPLAGRLRELRLNSQRDPSGSAQVARFVLSNLGVQLEGLVAGRPDVRGHSGYVFRWGEGWFEEFRDGGPGWNFQRNDKSAVDVRSKLLLDIFRPRRRSGLPALLNSLQLQISDAASEAPI